MNDQFTIFIITNGRSTFEYCLRSVKESDVEYPIVIVKDMNFHEAMQYCLDTCQTDYFFKIDDDFIVHPRALGYMAKQISGKNIGKFGIYYCFIWEDYTQRIRESIKFYNKKAVIKIKGFHSDPNTGKIDGFTNRKLKNNGFPLICDGSVVAIHACGTFEEHERYQELWNKISTKPWQKPTRKHIKKYSKSIEDQYDMRLNFLENLNKNTKFGKYLKGLI